MTHSKGIQNSKRKSSRKSMAKMETYVTTTSPFPIPIKGSISFHYVLFFLCQFSERISTSISKILSKTTHTSSNLLSSSAPVPYNHITNAALSAVSLRAGTVPPCHTQWQLRWHFEVHFIAHSPPPPHTVYIIYLKMSVCLSVSHAAGCTKQ